MSQPVPVGAWLTVKKLVYAEENSFGTLATTPSYTLVGHNSQLYLSPQTRIVALPQPGSTDPQILVEAGADTYEMRLRYYPTDFSLARYALNPAGTGSGSIDKSVSLLTSIALGGSGETFFQALGCRIATFEIGGKAGQLPLSVNCRLMSQVIPLPVLNTPLPGVYPSNVETVPLQFKDGGAQPIRIDGAPLNVNSI